MTYGKNYHRIFTISEIVPLFSRRLKSKLFIRDTFKIRMKRKYKVFYKAFCCHGEIRCVDCGKKAIYILMVGESYLELYADDGTIMTKDHILPKSLGGSNTSDANLQVMCFTCNSAKDNKLRDKDIKILVATRGGRKVLRKYRRPA